MAQKKLPSVILRAGEDPWHRREVGPLVLVPHGASDLDAPHLVRPGAIPKRLERDRHLHRVAALEPSGLRRPHGIPVRVGPALIDDRVVSPSSQWIRIEGEPAAAVVERVEQHADVLVVAQAAGVAPQLVDDPLCGRGRIKALAREIHVLVVVRDPDVAALRGWLAVVGRHLDQSAERRLARVHVLVQHAVERERLRELDRTHRGLASRVARNDSGSDRRGGSVDHGR